MRVLTNEMSDREISAFSAYNGSGNAKNKKGKNKSKSSSTRYDKAELEKEFKMASKVVNDAAAAKKKRKRRSKAEEDEDEVVLEAGIPDEPLSKKNKVSNGIKKAETTVKNGMKTTRTDKKKRSKVKKSKKVEISQKDAEEEEKNEGGDEDLNDDDDDDLNDENDEDLNNDEEKLDDDEDLNDEDEEELNDDDEEEEVELVDEEHNDAKFITYANLIRESESKKSAKLSENEKSSEEKGLEYLEWIISPITKGKFFDDVFEKRPLHLKRGKSNYFKGIFSTSEFDRILRDEQILFGRNLDVTSYDPEEGRQTHNPPGRAFAPVVWDFYNNGCSLRMLNPQTFSDGVYEG